MFLCARDILLYPKIVEISTCVSKIESSNTSAAKKRLRCCLIPSFNLTQGSRSDETKDKYVFLYIYFTTRAIQRYVFTG